MLNNAGSPTEELVVRAVRSDIALSAAPFVLVLDDFHLIDSPAIMAALTVIVPQCASQMRVVILSRHGVSLSLARLSTKENILEIGESDLRFSDREAYELLRRNDAPNLSMQAVSSINARAEGWGAGLHLASLYLRQRADAEIRQFVSEESAPIRSVEKYLWEEVIDRQAAPVRAFLLATSILDRFSASLCEAVTGRNDCAGLIHSLETNRLFLVPLDERGEWYRYHHLFREALRDHFGKSASAAEIQELHRRAATWFEQREIVSEALRHALRGRDWHQIERLLDRISTIHFQQDRLASLCDLLRDVPVPVLERNPLLAFRLAWALVRTGEFGPAAHPLQIARDALLTSHDRTLVASLLILEAYRDLYDSAPRTIEWCLQALDTLENDQYSEQGSALSILGWAHMYSGDLDLADAAFSRARKMVSLAPETWTVLSEVVGSASVLVQRGRL